MAFPKKGFTPDVILLIIVGLMPAMWLGWNVWGSIMGTSNALGANPVETLIRQLGVWGLRFLLIGLAVTPVAKIFRQPRLNRWRRPLGLLAFFYIALHLTTYFWLDLEFVLKALIKDILKRPFITLGMLAFVLLIPLAATSFNAAIKAMTYKAWKNLHKLVYVIVPLGVLHYYLLVKADHRPPIIYGVIVAVLLAWRVWDAARKRAK
jgi:methionine sulfoxide reductase heme-binding subunit